MKRFIVIVEGQSFNFNDRHYSEVSIDATSEEQALHRAKRVSDHWAVHSQSHRIKEEKELEPRDPNSPETCNLCKSLKPLTKGPFAEAYCRNCGEIPIQTREQDVPLHTVRWRG